MKHIYFACLIILSFSLSAQLKKVTFDPTIKIKPEDISIQTVRNQEAQTPKTQSDFSVKVMDMMSPAALRSGLKPGIKNERNVPLYIEGRIGNTDNRNANIESLAMQYIQAASGLMKIKNPDQEFVVKSVETDDLGMTHVRMQQQVKGIAVYGTEVIIHGKNNNFDFLNGSYFPTIENINIMPALDQIKCLKIVADNISEKPAYADDVKMLFKNLKEKAEMVIYPHEGKFILAYHVVTYRNLVERWEYFVDAQSGDIIKKYQSICKFHNHNATDICNEAADVKKAEEVVIIEEEVLDGKATANALDLFGSSRQINTYQVGSKYYMLDGSRDIFATPPTKMPNDPTGVIWTIDAFNTSPSKDNFKYDHVTSTNNTWNNRTSVSAHYNGGKSYEYFINTFGRKSINGMGGNIVSIINVTDDDGASMGNAFWNGQAMFYGNGDGAFQPLARGLDVAGHEMSHGVIENTANLEYEGESGALNESFADVFGVLIDRDDWKIGEDVVKISAFPSGALRSMDDPHNGAATNDLNSGWQPRHYNERYKGTEDNGGVHINSGIPNWAFYKFATAVGKDKAEKVYYRALSNYLTKSSRFVDCRIAVIKATTDLYGNTEINAAKKAFDEVGILGETSGNYQTDVQANPGAEFVVTTNPNNSGLFLYSTSGTLQRQISTTSIISKPSISDDGKYIIFVGEDLKIHEITLDWTKNPLTVQEAIIGTSPVWRNAIISKDGLKIAACTQDTINEIIVFYLGGSTVAQNSFELYNPTYTQGVSTGDVLYADAMEFDVTGEFIMYDAENEIKSSSSGSISYWDIGFIKVWNNKTKTFSLGSIDKLFSSLPDDVSIGNPAFSKNSPYIIAFDYIGEEGEISILASNTETGTTNLIFENNELGYPNFSAKDNKMVFDYGDANNTTYNIGIVDLKTNKIEPAADPFQFINNRRWATWFSNGKRVLSDTKDTELTLSSYIKIQGNPVGDFLQITLAEHLSKNPTITIYDISGKQILTQQISGSESYISLNTATLTSGLYTATITSDTHHATIKFVKQ
jgi:Zn-dependent metalloprotease